MSNSSTTGDQHDDRASEPTDDRPGDDHSIGTLSLELPASIRKVGFWSAIVLPILYVPILARGLSTSLEAGLFLGLLAFHLAALYVGHTYCR